ncbi:MAG: maleylacetate reductase [Woeseiaceae bacterium]
MQSTLNSATSARVLFGSGTLAELPNELDRLGRRRALVLSTEAQGDVAERLSTLLGNATGSVFSGAAMHTPVDVTEAAMKVVEQDDIDCLVAVGGGSTTGLSKAIAWRTGLPQIILPTTYAGSEMTPILGQTEDGLKTTLSDPRVLPGTVIYDVKLTLGLSADMSGPSGINAIAHAVEAMYAENRNESTSELAEEGIRRLSSALPAIIDSPGDIEARTDALFGAALCGICLANVGMALHHKLCHTLGGSFGLPHAETHTAVLPHAVQYNAAAEPDVMDRISAAIGEGSAPEALFSLGESVGANMALRDLGLQEADLDRAADLAVQNPYWNPRPLERDAIRELLTRAWAGERPA